MNLYAVTAHLPAYRNFFRNFAALYQHRTIRKILGYWVLAVFLLCNTPTTVLHYLFADHQDEWHHAYSADIPQLANAGIDCHLFGTVVNTPYVYEYQPFVFETVAAKNAFVPHVTNHFYAQPLLYFTTRGPPVLG